MKIGIIGAGFTGLAAAFRLSKEGVDVSIFEKSDRPGGLAAGFKDDKWKWSLDKHYHHLFTSDQAVRKLAEEIGQEIVFSRPLTSTYYDGDIYQLDSPISLLKFPKLPFIDRLRTGICLFYLKYITPWKPLEAFTAEKFIKGLMGDKSWEVLWKPLFKGKFDKYYNEISASWFWARIKKRSSSLGYPVGGFQNFSDTLVDKITDNKGKIYLNTEVNSIYKQDNEIYVKTGEKTYKFDRVICTLPSPVFEKITKGLSNNYRRNLKKLDGIGAINVVLSLKNSFFKNDEYWLSVNDNKMPFIAVVEHTNFVDGANYEGEHLLYIGNYFQNTHPYYKLSASKLIDKFVPYLKKINPGFKKSDISKSWIIKDNFAQPIVRKNYSQNLLSNMTPIKGLYLANIQQVYPWDRGTNYAVEMGFKVANMVIQSK